MIDQIKQLLGKLCSFSQKRLGFSKPPRLFLRSDSTNALKMLGKTAYYDPNKKSVTLFIYGRHPKDVLRSFAHELVHHAQNERGDLSPDKITSNGSNYAQECPHMRKMEQEAYLKGNMCFRDWEDTIQDKDRILIKLAESKFNKENRTMTTKITKEFLKQTIRNILETQLEEGVCGAAKRGDGVCPSCGKVHEEVELEENEELEEKKAKPDYIDIDGDGNKKESMKKAAADLKKKKKKKKANESKINTPEGEIALYEQRFASKNNRLFEKLLKEWTK